MKKTLAIAYFTLAAMMMLTFSAQAYIDPAATSYIIQVVAGIVITVGVALGVFWKKIQVFFRNLKMKTLEKKLTAEAAKKEAQKG